ncbi:Restriction of telomere capping protein 5 [Aspergillus terreus]
MEELSYVLAERFATKCFTPLELTHFKDNFFTRAIDQAGMKYWNEKILSDFLGIPDSSDAHCPLDAGPVIFRMVSFLGAFPFQNTLAPSVLTFDSMVKVAVLLTERYGKVLRRARKDRIRLLFGSLADVGRKDADQPPPPDENAQQDADSSNAPSHAPGFSIDEPANDAYDDEDDDDDLALAALESLDAIEVFRHDSRMDKAVYEARISVATFRRLLMLLLVISPLKPLEPVRTYTSDLNESRMEAVRKEADNILAAFPQEHSGGISYKSFAKTIATSLPYLFDPLTPLFEHLLFSKNLDLSQKRERSDSAAAQSDDETVDQQPSPVPEPESIMLPGSFESSILDPVIISHLSFFLPSTNTNSNLLRGNLRLHPVFSTAAHGSSLTSFSHNVITWQSGTLFLLEGTVSAGSEQGETITLGAYLPQPWTSGSSSSTSSRSGDQSTAPCSLRIDTNLETADFHVSPIGQNGAFLPPPTGGPECPTQIQIDIYNLEIWGLVPDPDASSEKGMSAIELQQAKWDFEAREAERRRNLNLKAGAGDSAREGARWLLETAGIIGDGSYRK